MQELIEILIFLRFVMKPSVLIMLDGNFLQDEFWNMTDYKKLTARFSKLAISTIFQSKMKQLLRSNFGVHECNNRELNKRKEHIMAIIFTLQKIVIYCDVYSLFILYCLNFNNCLRW